MKRRSVLVITLNLVYLFTCFSIGACASPDKGNTPKLATSDQTVYTVPAEKAQKWESIQNMVKREYNVCVEHCGNDKTCLDRCEKVYKNRLDREYKGLMHE